MKAPVVAEPVSFVNAPQIAEQRGISVRETMSSDALDYVNLIVVRGDQGTHVRQHVRAVVGGREAADPAVEELHGVGAGVDLRVEVGRDRAPEALHQRAPRARVAQHERLGARVEARAAALDQVGGEGEGRAGEADQRDRRRQRGPRPSDGFGDVCERAGLHLAQAVDVGPGAHGVPDRGTVAARELEPRAHRLEDEQDVGEDDGRVDAEPHGRLDRHRGGEVRRAAQLQEARLLADRPVLGQVAARLPHEPDRRVARRLAAARREKRRGFHPSRAT